MATIWETTKTALTSLGISMAANSYIVPSGSSWPSEYLVYQVISEPSLQSKDDTEALKWYRVQVTYYSQTGLAAMPGIAAAMAAAGFRRTAGRELDYNRETRHYAYAMDFSYLAEA